MIRIEFKYSWGAVMNLEQAVLENIRVLPTEKKQEVLDFAEFLRSKSLAEKPRRILKGALAHLKIEVSEKDIRDARQEMWRGYLKEDFE